MLMKKTAATGKKTVKAAKPVRVKTVKKPTTRKTSSSY